MSNQLATNKKVEASTTLSNLVSEIYKDTGNIRKYIIKISNLVKKLRGFKLEFEDILVHILISLPAQFNRFKISYNTQKKHGILMN